MARRRILTTLAAAAIAVVGLAACSGGDLASPDGTGDPTGATGGSGDTVKVSLGTLAIAPSAAIQYGIDHGIFAEHGFDVELTLGQGGAAVLPAVSNGSIDLGVGNPLSILTAADQGLDMRIVSGYSHSIASGEDINGVVVRADSGIASWKDLEGKTVATNSLRTQGDLTIRESVEKDGGDPAAVNFTEIAFADMEAQLELGNVDAVWLPEPFLSRAIGNADNVLVGYPNQNTIPGLPTMVLFTSGAYADANAEQLKEFTAALEEVLSTATSDTTGFPETISEFTGMPLEAAQNLRLEKLTTELDPSIIQSLGDLAVKFQYIQNEPDIDKIVLKL